MSGTFPLLVTALVIATSGLVYELLAGAVASWVLGDTVTQFSTVIGLDLSALGLGSWLSGRMHRHLAEKFVAIEIGVALVGGLLTPALFVVFANAGHFRAVLYPGVALCGTLVGLEIPLLVRILREREELSTAIARVLTFDHLGSLVGALLFSLWLMPRVGPLRTSLAFGIVNAAVAIATTFALRRSLARPAVYRIAAVATIAVLAGVFTQTDRLAHAVDLDVGTRVALGRAAPP